MFLDNRGFTGFHSTRILVDFSLRKHPQTLPPAFHLPTPKASEHPPPWLSLFLLYAISFDPLQVHKQACDPVREKKCVFPEKAIFSR